MTADLASNKKGWQGEVFPEMCKCFCCCFFLPIATIMIKVQVVLILAGKQQEVSGKMYLHYSLGCQGKLSVSFKGGGSTSKKKLRSKVNEEADRNLELQ